MPSPPRPLRFVLVGAWNTLFGYLAFAGFYLLTQVLGIHYLFATLPAQAIAIVNAYICHRTFVFGEEAAVASSFARFAAVYWAGFLVNLALLPLLVTFLHLHPLAAQGILTALTVGTSYFAHSRWTFSR